jgi:hypothetical protein
VGCVDRKARLAILDRSFLNWENLKMDRAIMIGLDVKGLLGFIVAMVAGFLASCI